MQVGFIWKIFQIDRSQFEKDILLIKIYSVKYQFASCIVSKEVYGDVIFEYEGNTDKEYEKQSFQILILIILLKQRHSIKKKKN